MTIPLLLTERLRLRAIEASDLDAFAAMHANPEVMRFLGAGRPRTREETWDTMAAMRGQWALRGYGVFALERREAPGFIGRAGILHPGAWPEPELAYGLDQPWWGKGLALEAAVAIRNWAFASFPFPRMISYVRPANVRSVGILKALGARLESESELLGGPAQIWVHPRPAGG